MKKEARKTHTSTFNHFDGLKVLCARRDHPSIDLPLKAANRPTKTVQTMPKESKKGACSAHVETAKANCLQHVRREGKAPSYVNPHLTQNNRTVFEDEMISGRKSIVPLKNQAEKLYTEKTGQKCQKSFAPFREDVLKLKPGITDQQLMNFKAKVEAETGWKVMGIWLHQDEGHYHSRYIEGDEDFDLNIHAHVLYSCQDQQTGRAIRINRSYFRLRQDWLAAATGMERGTPVAETGRKHRSAMQQRIYSMEQRIEQLEEVILRVKDEIEKLNITKAAKEKIMGWFGQSVKDKEIAKLQGQKEALQATMEKERTNYASQLEKTRQKANLEANKALCDIVGLIDGFVTPEKVNAQGTLEKVRQVVEAKEMWERVAERSEKELKALRKEMAKTEELGTQRGRGR